MATVRYVYDDNISFVFTDVRMERVQSILPIIVVSVVLERKSKENQSLHTDYYEVGILGSQKAYSITRNNNEIAGCYYPDAGKETCSMPVDIFQQVMRVLMLKG